MTIIPACCSNIVSEKNINQAISVLQNGGVIAYPTEAVFGLGCDPQQEASVKRLLQIKQRSPEKGLILIASDFAQLLPYIDTAKISQTRWSEVQASWPGPVTWLIPAMKNVPELIRGQHSTIAVRVSAHPLVKELCEAFGGAIISTSANRSGQQPARTIDEARMQLGELIDYIVEGEVGGDSKPTEIRDAVSGKIIRPRE